MTDERSRDPRADDGLVSAVLDGEATDEDRSRVEADPALRQRLERFRAVAENVSTPPELPSADVFDAMRSTALGSAASGPADPSVPQPPPPPQLAARRRPRRRIELPSPALAAAVLIVLALIGVGLVVRGSNGSSRNTASSAKAGRQDERTASEAIDQTTTTSRAPLAGVQSLGTFANQVELTQALARLPLTTLRVADATAKTDGPGTTGATSSGGPSSPPAPSAAAVDRCDQVIRAVPGQHLGERRAVATAVLADRPVLVYSHPMLGPDGAATSKSLLSVADVETCRIFFAVQR